MSVSVDASYPGGNIIVEGVDGQTVRVRQDLRDTTEWWFYWNMRVRGAAGSTIRVQFVGYDGKPGPVGPNGPVVKLDDDPPRWADCEFSEREFTFDVPAGVEEARFSFCFPYLVADFDAFLEGIREDPEVSVKELAVSRKGRSAPLIVLGNPETAARHVVFTCRHHCCESQAAYALEGVIAGLLDESAEDLLRTTAFHIAPMMDIDGVEEGDQGKLRDPHDHNRDYGDEPLYPTVGAMQSLIRDLGARGLVMCVDFHCPWIRNGNNEAVFFVEPSQPYATEMHAFGDLLGKTDTGGVVYTGEFDQKYGHGWNSGTSPTFGRFCRENGGDALRTQFTLEFSYSVNEGDVATPENSRVFGRGFARALVEYLGG